MKKQLYQVERWWSCYGRNPGAGSVSTSTMCLRTFDLCRNHDGKRIYSRRCPKFCWPCRRRANTTNTRYDNWFNTINQRHADRFDAAQADDTSQDTGQSALAFPHMRQQYLHPVLCAAPVGEQAKVPTRAQMPPGHRRYQIAHATSASLQMESIIAFGSPPRSSQAPASAASQSAASLKHLSLPQDTADMPRPQPASRFSTSTASSVRSTDPGSAHPHDPFGSGVSRSSFPTTTQAIALHFLVAGSGVQGSSTEMTREERQSRPLSCPAIACRAVRFVSESEGARVRSKSLPQCLQLLHKGKDAARAFA
jgi:hypothetical protein